MAITPIFTEADWKKNGMSRLSDAERRANKQKVTEALQDYACADKMICAQLWENPSRTQALKQIKATLVEAAGNYKTNKEFVAHVSKMLIALPAEKNRANNLLATLTLTQIYANAKGYQAFLEFAKKDHSSDGVEFLRVWPNMNRNDLVNTFFRDGAPKLLNLALPMRAPMIKEPRDTSALNQVVKKVGIEVSADTLKRFKSSLAANC